MRRQTKTTIGISVLVALIISALALADTVLKDEGTTIGPISSLNCVGNLISCSRGAAGVGAISVSTDAGPTWSGTDTANDLATTGMASGVSGISASAIPTHLGGYSSNAAALWLTTSPNSANYAVRTTPASETQFNAGAGLTAALSVSGVDQLGCTSSLCTFTSPVVASKMTLGPVTGSELIITSANESNGAGITLNAQGQGTTGVAINYNSGSTTVVGDITGRNGGNPFAIATTNMTMAFVQNNNAFDTGAASSFFFGVSSFMTGKPMMIWDGAAGMDADFVRMRINGGTPVFVVSKTGAVINNNASTIATTGAHLTSTGGHADLLLDESTGSKIGYDATTFICNGANCTLSGGPLNVAGNVTTANNTFSGTASTAKTNITGGISAANATTSVPAVQIWPANVLDANDLIFAVANATPTNVFTVDLEGDVKATGDLVGARSCIGTDCTLAWSNSGNVLTYNAGGSVNFGVANVTIGSGATVTAGGNAGGGLALGGNTATFKVVNVADSAATPTISSGFGGSPSVASSNGTAAFTVNVGTGGAASSGVIGLPTASNGWVCSCNDVTTFSTTVFLTRQTASATTSCTIGNFTNAAASAAWAASDILHCIARAR